MLKFSPCIEMIYNDIDFYDRFARAAKNGCKFVEFWGWEGRDLDRMAKECADNGLRITSVCVGSRNKEVAEAHGKYKLMYREGIPAFVAACEESIEMAKKMNIPSLIVTTGNTRNDIPRCEQHTNIVLALKAVAPLFEASGIQLIVEPLNVLKDHMGYYLDSSYEAFGIIEEVGSPSIKILYDIYHQQITEGNLIPTIRKNIDKIGHFHVADNPGRNQPGTGEINYKNVFKAIVDLGYEKFVGLEYSPTIKSEDAVDSTFAILKEI